MARRRPRATVAARQGWAQRPPSALEVAMGVLLIVAGGLLATGAFLLSL